MMENEKVDDLYRGELEDRIEKQFAEAGNDCEFAQYRGIYEKAWELHPVIDDEKHREDSFLSWNGVVNEERIAYIHGALRQVARDNRKCLRCFCMAKCPMHTEVENENCRQNGKCQDFERFEEVLLRENPDCSKMLEQVGLR